MLVEATGPSAIDQGSAITMELCLMSISSVQMRMLHMWLFGQLLQSVVQAWSDQNCIAHNNDAGRIS